MGDEMDEYEQLLMVVKQLADQVLIMARSLEQLQHRMKKLEFETTDANSYVPDMNQKYEG